MNLKYFEEEVEAHIVDRGYMYYEGGRVSDFEKLAEGVYEFTVAGSTNYHVKVDVGEGLEILWSECDCPFDYGPICKHEVAVFYELRNMQKGSVVTKQSLKNVLEELPQEELVSIILEVTSKDSILEKSLLLKYARLSHGELIHDFEDQIREIVDKHQGRHHFVDYYHVDNFVDDLYTVFHKVSELVSDTQYEIGISVGLSLLTEVLEAFNYTDDSCGFLGGLATEIIELIGEAMSAINQNKAKKMVLTNIMNTIDDPVFNEWSEYKIDLLNLCVEWGSDESIKNILEQNIDSRLRLLGKKDGDYEKFKIENLLTILLRLKQLCGDELEVDAFIAKHLDYPSFRREMIEKYKQQEAFDKVVHLTLEAEEKDKSLPGLVNEWREVRYDAYVSLGETKKQEDLAYVLLCEGKFNYYDELKKLNQVDFETYYSKLIYRLKGNFNRDVESMYLKIIDLEQDVVEMMYYVTTHRKNIEGFAKYLVKVPSYREEVIILYLNLIYLAAQGSTNRSHYRQTCGIIKRFKVVSTLDEYHQLIRKLMELYKRRPAFVEELSFIS